MEWLRTAELHLSIPHTSPRRHDPLENDITLQRLVLFRRRAALLYRLAISQEFLVFSRAYRNPSDETRRTVSLKDSHDANLTRAYAHCINGLEIVQPQNLRYK